MTTGAVHPSAAVAAALREADVARPGPTSIFHEQHRLDYDTIMALIPPEACYLGWQESLQLLVQLVEPDIPA